MADITLTFGKHNGKKLSQVPTDYVRWLSEQATICGKKDIPQAAKAFLASKPVASSETIVHDRECCFCCKPINGSAIPVRETYRHQTITKYAHRICAERAAEED